jgi:hypothetical protein
MIKIIGNQRTGNRDAKTLPSAESPRPAAMIAIIAAKDATKCVAATAIAMSTVLSHFPCALSCPPQLLEF